MKPNPIHSFLLPVINGDKVDRSSMWSAGSSHGSLPRPTSDADGPALWSEFWREFHPVNQPHERCHIPGDGRQAVDRHWSRFAAGLPREARVIDLGCGAGIVGRTLLNCRPDLHVTGIDFADVPTPQLAKLTIHPRTSMEALPFDNGYFDAAISLFGIEYGNIDKTAGELSRVLKQNASFSFLMHHSGSEIVCEGGTRLRGLRALLSGKVKAAFLAGSTDAIDQQLGRLKHQFPDEPSIKLFSRFLLHFVTLARQERKAKWRYLVDGLAAELALLTQLERNAKSAVKLGNWLVPLLPIMNVISVSVLRRSSGDAIAWQISGTK